MKVLRYIAVSFSLYSRVPMPRFSWREEDMSHSLIFFPFVGVLIGLLIMLLNMPALMRTCPLAARVLVTLAIPLFVTGGIHVDGFMDTEDALRSYASPERKLEILKDPHVGAFAVIGLMKMLLVFGASTILILMDAEGDYSGLMIFAGIFVMARCLSGLTSLLYPKAKKEGMLYEETKRYEKSVLIALSAEMLATVIFAVGISPRKGIPVLLSLAVCALHYRSYAVREFGGVTGDTAGRFLVVAETVSAATLAVCTLIFR